MISINLTHWTMKTPQNVLEMSTVSPDTSKRRRRHWLMAATTIESSSFLHSTKGITPALLEMQLQLCPEYTQE